MNECEKAQEARMVLIEYLESLNILDYCELSGNQGYGNNERLLYLALKLEFTEL